MPFGKAKLFKLTCTPYCFRVKCHSHWKSPSTQTGTYFFYTKYFTFLQGACKKPTHLFLVFSDLRSYGRSISCFCKIDYTIIGNDEKIVEVFFKTTSWHLRPQGTTRPLFVQTHLVCSLVPCSQLNFTQLPLYKSTTLLARSIASRKVFRDGKSTIYFVDCYNS